MGVTNYSPNNGWPDWEGNSAGPIQFPQDGDPITFEVNYIGAGGTAAKHGIFGKLADSVFFLKRALMGTAAPNVPSLTREQELRIVNVKTPGTEVVSGGGTRSAYLGQQEGAAQTGTIPAAKSKASGAAGEFFWLALDLPPAGTLASVSISTIGNLVANPPAHTPTYQVVKYKGNTAEVSVSGAATADAHSGNWLSTVVATAITVGVAIDPTYKYAVLVTSPWDVGFSTMLEVRGLNFALA